MDLAQPRFPSASILTSPFRAPRSHSVVANADLGTVPILVSIVLRCSSSRVPALLAPVSCPVFSLYRSLYSPLYFPRPFVFQFRKFHILFPPPISTCILEASFHLPISLIRLISHVLRFSAPYIFLYSRFQSLLCWCLWSILRYEAFPTAHP